uniref:Uncharacterized protein n=1 Tax=Anguilla anguilla TaxID=7936 RepID=A0A0E9PZ37_ANGAN
MSLCESALQMNSCISLSGL